MIYSDPDPALSIISYPVRVLICSVAEPKLFVSTLAMAPASARTSEPNFFTGRVGSLYSILKNWIDQILSGRRLIFVSGRTAYCSYSVKTVYI
jgi:hypothetical protein